MKLSDFDITHRHVLDIEKEVFNKELDFTIKLNGYWIADIIKEVGGAYRFTIDGVNHYNGCTNESELLKSIHALIKNRKTTYEVLDNQLNLLYDKYNGGTK